MKELKYKALASLLTLVLPAIVFAGGVPKDLTELSLEDLLNIQVTSVSRQKEPLSGAAAAIQVITADDIAASTARNLPEALRLFSGLSVAQINGRSWAIASRGFNASTSDKLEVRLDGRSLYTPLFSGVTWEALSLPLERIDRIEVIRGPGASIWGANAVNGVINIVTKPAQSGTHTMLASGGQLKRWIAVNQGQDFGHAGRWELYLRDYEQSALEWGSERPWSDNLERSGMGLRVDLKPSLKQSLMFSFSAHNSVMGSQSALPGTQETMRGFDAISRWTKQLNNNDEIEVQLNVDETWRHIPGHFGENRQQADLDVRLQKVWRGHQLLFGAGVRHSRDEIDNGAVVRFDPEESRLNTVNLYVQDRMSFGDALHLTVGTKLESNHYTDVEVQPSIRMSWTPSSEKTLWAAVSQATRTPSRVDRDLGSVSPGGGGIITNDTFESERARFYELGWRSRLNDRLSLDAAGWYADYDKLRGVSVLDTAGTLVVANNGRGRSFGTEIDLLWAASDSLRMWLGYAWQDIDYQAYPDRNDVHIANNNERDPAQQLKIRSIWSINDRWRASGFYRYIDELKDSNTPAYSELDLKLSVRLNSHIELSLSGLNLLNDTHPEFNDGSGALISRQVYLGLHWDL